MRYEARRATLEPLTLKECAPLVEQSSWGRPIGENFATQWAASAPPREHFRLLCQAQPHASAWLTVDPCPALGLRFSPFDFQVLCRRWLGVPPFPSLAAAQCQACGSQGDVQGDHVLCCAQYGRYARHNALRDAPVMIAEAAGYVCEREVAVQPNSQRRPGDLRVIGFDRGVNVDVDASVVHLLQLSLNFAPEDVNVAVVRQEAMKIQYSQELCNRAGVRLALAVVATTGGWGTESTAFLRHLFRAYRSRHPGSASSVLSALWGRVSVPVATAVSRQLSRAVLPSTLDK